MYEESIDMQEQDEKSSNDSSLKERLLARWNSLGRGRWVMVTVAVLLVSGIVVWAIAKPGQSTIPTEQPDGLSLDVDEPEEIVTKSLPLTGELVTEEEYDSIMKYLPMAVMVENLTVVRPVSGLSQADLVYEALVEGGITRYMIVFHSKDVEEIMPVRSSRAYYLDWLQSLDSTYMHVGGAVSSNPRASALPRIYAEGIKSYQVVNRSWLRKAGVAAPHNAYTSTLRMKDGQVLQGWSRPPEIEMWQFKDDVSEEERVDRASTIDLNWSTWGANGYSVRWVYLPEGNVYLYEVGGVRQTDAATGDDVFAKNVVIQYTAVALANDGTSRVVYDTTGTGPAKIFMDGVVIEGTWRKPDLDSRERYFDADGHEIEFNRGKTWIQMVPNESQVTIQ